MIEFLERKDIDDKLYDLCISNALQCRLYAYTWYLDIVADDWGALVYGNYEAVMPIPYMRALKYWKRKRIIQPFLCQQLGIFTSTEQPEIERIFVENFLQLNPVNYAFNSDNFIDSDFDTKPNYELPLRDDYDRLKMAYRKDRKYRINQANKNNLAIQESSDFEQMISMAKEHYDLRVYNRSFFNTLRKLISSHLERNLGTLYYVKTVEELVGAAFFITSQDRIVYLFSSFSNKGKELQAPSYLINYVIEKYSGQDRILDFEGSSISGIASFFKSFGAQKKEFKVYNHRRK